MSGGPCVGCEIGDALHLCIGESGQDVSEVEARTGILSRRQLSTTERIAANTRSGLLPADVDPVFATARIEAVASCYGIALPLHEKKVISHAFGRLRCV